jgi:hypothetical protein
LSVDTPRERVSTVNEGPLATVGWVGGPAVVTFGGLTAATAVAPAAAFFASLVGVAVGAVAAVPLAPRVVTLLG